MKCENNFSISPNPSSNNISINYYLPEFAFVTLSINSSIGESIEKITEGEFQYAGWHKFNIDVSSFPSGVYFCTLQAGSEVITKKFVIIK